jgi:hypothetical protein
MIIGQNTQRYLQIYMLYSHLRNRYMLKFELLLVFLTI